jgi:hypothetical protein
VGGRVAAATGYLTSVSCPSASLCVADGDPYGSPVVYSTDPVGGARTWKVAYTPSSSGPGTSGVLCPSVSLCVLFDADGDVITATHPRAGQRAWRLAGIDSVNELSSVSCASATLCVAGGSGNRLITSTDPTAGAGAWHAATVGLWPYGISCSTVTLCVAGAGDGHM